MKDLTVYRPNDRARVGFFRSLLVLVRHTIESKELIFQLFKRDFLMSYKKSFLGMTWIFISPILGVISWVFMNAMGILNPGVTGVPYPVYVLLSTTIFGIFGAFITAGSTTLSSGASFILQVNYPHEVLLFKEVAQMLANLILSFALNLLVIAAFGVALRWQLLLLPLFMLPLFLLGAGLGLFQAIVAQVAPDIQKGLVAGTGLLMFVTPVLYSLDAIEGKNIIVQKIMKYNPLSYLIGAPRDLILTGSFTLWQGYWLSVASAFVVFSLCWHFFYLTEQRVIERML